MTVFIVYWSGSGNTEIMAKKMYEGVLSTGCECILRSLEKTTPAEVLKYEKIMFGCPSMGIEQLEEEDFEPFFQQVEPHLAGKKVAIFGSYGWGDGEWMIDWKKRLIDKEAIVFEDGLKVNSTPSTQEENICFEFGARFAKE